MCICSQEDGRAADGSEDKARRGLHTSANTTSGTFTTIDATTTTIIIIIFSQPPPHATIH